MKHSTLLAAAFFVCTGLLAADEVVTFYRVPLVCGAAPDIGCGSRAKPVLLEMEATDAILEAWLNREGTVYAIVWKEKDLTGPIAKPIFSRHAVDYDRINKNDVQPLLGGFRQQGQWLRATEVDQLSLIEAGRIADDAVSFLIADSLATDTEVAAIRADVEAYFRTELVKLRTVDELMRDCSYAFQVAVITIYEKHLGKERTDRIIDAYGVFQSAAAKGTKCCNKKGDSCCH